MATENTKPTVLRQLRFPIDTYQEVEEMMHQENKRLGYITRKEKISGNNFIPVLVQDGLDYRNGKVYVPDKMELNEKQVEALTEAKVALRKFNKLI